MNEIKRSLIEVAGDMGQSKDRVRKRLNKHQDKKEDFKKNFIAGTGAVAMIGVLFLVATILMNQQKDTFQSTTELFDDQVFKTETKIKKVWGDSVGEEYIKQWAYEDYERSLALYTYALSLGYEITDEEIKRSYVKTTQMMTSSEEIKSSYDELFSKMGITWEEYDQFALKNAPYQVASEKLQQHYMQLYPKIDSDIASSLAGKHAIPYFREQYTDDIKVFKEKHGLAINDSSNGVGQKVLGRIVAFEENMFLVVPSATLEDIENLSSTDIVKKYNEGIWYPQDDTPLMSVGDLVETYYKLQTSTETTPHFSDLWDLKIIDDYELESKKDNTIHLTIEKENISGVKSFVGMLNWEEMDVEFTNTADYQFVVNDITYQIWSYPDGFVLYSSRGEYRKINEDFTEELSGYLGISSGIN